MDKFFVKYDINYYITGFKMYVWKKDKKQKQLKMFEFTLLLLYNLNAK